ncbi:hypothetical protein [Bacteroides salyersiae]|uniref:hypothetical protein n=3 Tax=Bacteroides TaxID=816 RepID=UPI001CCAA704|nr:hypothetical protein [Bacteroides salyersiae]MCB6650048.1 hypothetical protein [Bacteroides salyersiae]MCS2407021.1 hypothetical protein [Bacteroides salyersiae]MCS2956654.1 hypothetical protein [Bacteroides salyersiae]MCS3057700.1 hypothetical protein [Bacteroides salyersiae]UYU39151.1 hypothetical protein KQP71_12240 [Bacteroides salyersiae]
MRDDRLMTVRRYKEKRSVQSILRAFVLCPHHISAGWSFQSFLPDHMFLLKIFFPESFVFIEISRYFAQILKIAMSQQEIRSKYHLRSDVFHPESVYFFSFLQKRYLVLW